MGFAALATVAFLGLSKKETAELKDLTQSDVAHADTPINIPPQTGGDGDGGGGGDGI